ncbi:rhodanese-related sulfurtransferase [Halarchaeum acidiphilum MH1-52-1]|uniref:Rhodanese-related sulfurtransferase n=1 Tax=Halarchaeum acidiphilum MH1-52-1 TaxID=1261545 RepID=U3A9B1_9EURY|nr:rhodanese-like domain-containing protein [Halarchaeum acidiphilum]GAD51323.1 rhodanese-related sulfurtransferase [Halarchaeum acidiphilum MH1-52-1]
MDGEITPAEVEALIDTDEDVRVVDIRPEAAYVRGHIPGSENVPFAALTRAVERFEGAERVVTVCPHGQSSVQAANLIASYEGVADDATVQSMAGGLVAWDGDLERAERVAEDEGPDTTDAPDAPF